MQAVNETRRYILFYVSLTLSPPPRHCPLLLLFLFLFLSLSLFLSLFRFLLREHISILRLIYLVNKFCILLFFPNVEFIDSLSLFLLRYQGSSISIRSMLQASGRGDFWSFTLEKVG